jgi:hypothetical protein
MKKLLLLAALFASMPLSAAQINCLDLGREEVKALYCELRDSEAELESLKANCEKEADIYQRVASDISEKAKSFRPTSKEAFQLQMLSMEYTSKVSGVLSVQTQFITLSIQDMTAKWKSEDICNQ